MQAGMSLNICICLRWFFESDSQSTKTKDSNSTSTVRRWKLSCFFSNFFISACASSSGDLTFCFFLLLMAPVFKSTNSSKLPIPWSCFLSMLLAPPSLTRPEMDTSASDLGVYGTHIIHSGDSTRDSCIYI